MCLFLGDFKITADKPKCPDDKTPFSTNSKKDKSFLYILHIGYKRSCATVPFIKAQINASSTDREKGSKVTWKKDKL